MPEKRFDVVIIGGGPAGSTAATFLAQNGKSVLILEKEHFPRFHIGESLLPYNMPLFDEMGITGKLESAGFMPKYGAQFMLADGVTGTAIRFGGGRFSAQPKSFQVERSRFDEILIRHAEEAGASVREGRAVKNYRIGRDGVDITTVDDELIQSEFLIDASGMSNFTGNREGTRRLYENHRKVAIFGHFKGVPLPENDTSGDIVIFRLNQAWFWLIPLTKEIVSVGLVMDSGKMRESGLTPGELFEATIAKSPELARRMKNAVCNGELRTIADFSYQNSRFVSERLVRVGDAAGFLDPIFSSGVFLAMQSGKQGAKVIAEALGLGKTLTSGMRRYEKETRRTMQAYFELIENFYTTPFMDLLLQPEDRLGLPDAVIALLAGRTDGGWAVRWRLRMFFLLVKIQKYFPIARRLQYD